MSEQHMAPRSRNPGRAQPLLNPNAPESNDPHGGRNRRSPGTLLLAALVMMAGADVSAQSVEKESAGNFDPVAGLSLLFFTPAEAPPVPGPASMVPFPMISPMAAKIQFATLTYDFGKVSAGVVVNYAFTFTNVGSQTLEITNVRPSCGCTTAGEWSRTVAPGLTGTIPIQFNTANYSGQVGKSIMVTCNDPGQPEVMLQILGTIWQPIEVIPRFAMLNVTTESPSNATSVRIVNNAEQPLTLSLPESSHPAFAAELKTNQPGKEFELIVRTVPPLPEGYVTGLITLKTSSKNLPVLSISTMMNVQPTVMVSPPRIILFAGSLPNSMVYNVTIRNNGTNALVLTEPVMNAEGVGVQLREHQPGRLFSVALNFPAGFAIAPGNKVELSLKSNHPQFPVIKVPVLQAPRPTPTAMPSRVGPVLQPPLPPRMATPVRVAPPAPPQAAVPSK